MKKKSLIYNVPKDIIKLWLKKRIDNITTEIYSDNVDEYKLVIKTNILFRLYASYDLDLNELMSVITYLNNKNLLSKMNRTSKRGKNSFLFATYLVYDSSLNSLVAYENYFKRNEKFYGLLPTLYDLEDKKLYVKLVSILIDIVKNDALFCQEMVKSLIDFTQKYDVDNYKKITTALAICKNSSIVEDQISSHESLENNLITIYEWWI